MTNLFGLGDVNYFRFDTFLVAEVHAVGGVHGSGGVGIVVEFVIVVDGRIVGIIKLDASTETRVRKISQSDPTFKADFPVVSGLINYTLCGNLIMRIL